MWSVYTFYTAFFNLFWLGYLCKLPIFENSRYNSNTVNHTMMYKPKSITVSCIFYIGQPDDILIFFLLNGMHINKLNLQETTAVFVYRNRQHLIRDWKTNRLLAPSFVLKPTKIHICTSKSWCPNSLVKIEQTNNQ